MSLPAMAFVTYILLAALQSGLQSRFHPEIFGIVATKAIVVLLLDFLFVKGGCYLLGVQGSNPIVDLLAYAGYKFVGCVIWLNAFVNQAYNSQGDCNTLGWTGWTVTNTVLYHVYLHVLSKRLLSRAYLNYFLAILSRICVAAPFIALGCFTRCWCSTGSRRHRLSRPALAAYHLPLSRRCRADLIHGYISPCITRNA